MYLMQSLSYIPTYSIYNLHVSDQSPFYSQYLASISIFWVQKRESAHDIWMGKWHANSSSIYIYYIYILYISVEDWRIVGWGYSDPHLLQSSSCRIYSIERRQHVNETMRTKIQWCGGYYSAASTSSFLSGSSSTPLKGLFCEKREHWKRYSWIRPNKITNISNTNTDVPNVRICRSTQQSKPNICT